MAEQTELATINDDIRPFRTLLYKERHPNEPATPFNVALMRQLQECAGIEKELSDLKAHLRRKGQQTFGRFVLAVIFWATSILSLANGIDWIGAPLMALQFFATILGGFILSLDLRHKVEPSMEAKAFLFAYTPLVIVGRLLMVAFVDASKEEDDHARYVKKDNRYQEYLNLIQDIDTWNEFAGTLNRLALRIKYKQVPEALEKQARLKLEAMRADEEYMVNRIKYYSEIAAEGDLGTRVTKHRLTDVIANSSEQFEQMRTRMKELQEIDAKQIAELEVTAIEKIR